MEIKFIRVPCTTNHDLKMARLFYVLLVIMTISMKSSTNICLVVVNMNVAGVCSVGVRRKILYTLNNAGGVTDPYSLTKDTIYVAGVFLVQVEATACLLFLTLITRTLHRNISITSVEQIDYRFLIAHPYTWLSATNVAKGVFLIIHLRYYNLCIGSNDKKTYCYLFIIYLFIKWRDKKIAPKILIH